jgi:D-glycero-alpha-D-manno-heptose 1-phosphate guanylyltransferase
MNIKAAIVLAGGQGTRLQNTLPGIPKCLAPVNGRPFIDYLLDHLTSQGLEQFIFALGYESDHVQAHLNEYWPALDKVYAVETSPLGTGGAIKQAAVFIKQRHVAVVNADTLFKFDLQAARQLHESSAAECTILLKRLANFDRFGTVQVNDEMRVTGFIEKQPCVEGLINAGVYLLDLTKWQQHDWPTAFSFEKDYLQEKCSAANIMGQVQDAYFIDIGVPEDYQKAQAEFLSFYG